MTFFFVFALITFGKLTYDFILREVSDYSLCREINSRTKIKFASSSTAGGKWSLCDSTSRISLLSMLITSRSLRSFAYE